MAAHADGQITNLGQGSWICCRIRSRDPRAAAEQIQHTGLNARLSCACHGVTGHKAGMPLAPSLQHRLFDRTNIGDHRCFRQGRNELIRWVQQQGNGQRQDHQVATREAAGIGRHRAHQPSGHGAIRRGLTMHKALHRPAPRLQIQTKGSPDQAKANDPHTSRLHRHLSRRVVKPC